MNAKKIFFPEESQENFRVFRVNPRLKNKVSGGWLSRYLALRTNNPYFRMTYTARTPSFQLIFLPSSYVRP